MNDIGQRAILMGKGLNQTILGLKFKQGHIWKRASRCLNQTILGLKFNKYHTGQKEIICLNQTILGLKSLYK